MNVYVLQNQARSLNDYLIIILKKLDVFLLSFWSLNAHFFLIFWGFQVRGKSDVILKSPKWIMDSNTFALSHKRSWIVTLSSQFFFFHRVQITFEWYLMALFQPFDSLWWCWKSSISRTVLSCSRQHLPNIEQEDLRKVLVWYRPKTLRRLR